MIYLHPHARNSDIKMASVFKFRTENLNNGYLYELCKLCAVTITCPDSDENIINRIRESLDRLVLV